MDTRRDPIASTTASRRRRGRWAWRALAFVVLGYGATSWWISSAVTSPRRGTVAAPRRAIGHETVRLTAEDGISLVSWVVDRKGAKGAVLLFHGLGGRRYDRWLEFVRNAGYHGLAIDFRAHGESDGDTVTFGALEAADVRAAVGYARRRWPELPLAAWGMSMGAAAIIMAHEVTKELDAVVLDGMFSTIELTLQKRMDMRIPAILHPFAFGPKLATRIRTGVAPEDLRPVDHLSRFDPQRLLIATGALDDKAGPDELERLVAAAPGAASLVVEGAKHQHLFPFPVHAKRVREHFRAAFARRD